MNIAKCVCFSDGHVGQYKSKFIFHRISQSEEQYGFPPEHTYFGSRHGKGPSDGESAAIKSSAAAAAAVKARRVIIGNANDLFTYCSNNLNRSPESEELCSHFCMTFYYVPHMVRNDPLKLSTVSVTSRVHSVVTVTNGQIAIRSLSCFCQGCEKNGASHSSCKNKHHLSPWKFFFSKATCILLLVTDVTYFKML